MLPTALPRSLVAGANPQARQNVSDFFRARIRFNDYGAASPDSIAVRQALDSQGGNHMKHRRPSPALVISIAALVAACAGSAVAATVITSKQIQNGTIQNVDIRDATIRSGKLSKGVQNLINKKAPAPATGKIAYEQVRKAGPENQPANVFQRVTSLKVPAGAYVVTANTIMTAFTGETNILEALLGSNGSVGGTCILDVGGVTASSLQTIAINDRQTPATLGMQLTRTLGADTEIILRCAGGIAWRASESTIIATKVDSVTQTVEP
ncbi:MAG: hypothetical protein QOG94_1195 [Solirubrobacteraceae bacterium]|jgi:hypothetical protein|nr:hypothetical protein [Solirubrobacteraceae bacterium]